MLSRGELEKSVKKISAKNELVLLSLNVQTNELVLLKSYVRRSSAKKQRSRCVLRSAVIGISP
jgi:hypothetical protein